MKRVVLLFGMIFSVMSVFAEDNVLQTIEIVPVKDTYNIVLVSDKAVDVKKTVQAPNQINLTLKDIRASKTLNTVYNNVSNVDTVMVEQQGSGVSIFFQAENAEAASVSFDAITPAPVKTASTASSLKLSGPIESYAPIYKEDIETAKTSSLYNRLKSNSTLSGIKDSLEEAPSSDLPNKLITFGLVTLFVVAASRLFKRREPEMKIGLSQQMGMDTTNYGGVQQPMPGVYPNSSLAKPFTTVNYGLNAYKNENRNPYETVPMQIHNPRLRNYAQRPMPVQEPVAQPVMAGIQQQAVQTAPSRMTAPAAARETVTAPTRETPSNPNVDNLKFLESMTAIYEKSGRHDLARGLKASLSKNNIK